jgi:hypothetical protein
VRSLRNNVSARSTAAALRGIKMVVGGRASEAS